MVLLFILATHSYPPQCGGCLSVPESDASRVASSPSGGSSSFSPLGSTSGGPAGILPYHSMPVLLHLAISTTSGGLWVECLQPSLVVSGKLYVSSSCISSSVHLSKFLAEHVKGQLRCLILVAPCWMEAPWLPTVLNMLADIP